MPFYNRGTHPGNSMHRSESAVASAVAAFSATIVWRLKTILSHANVQV
jgi:hypothetical protein